MLLDVVIEDAEGVTLLETGIHVACRCVVESYALVTEPFPLGIDPKVGLNGSYLHEVHQRQSGPVGPIRSM